MYTKARFFLFICIGFYVHNVQAQVSFRQSSYLDLRVHYITNNKRENYQWLNPEKGKDAFIYLSEINVKNCNCPADLSKGLGIFKSFTLIGRWFNLLGEFASNPGMIYEYEDDFSFNEKGVKYTINKKLLAKYPSLLKRLKYAAPTVMDYTLRLNARDKQGDASGLELMVKDIDLLIPSENEMPYMVAGAPSKWRDRIIIGNYINQDESENKKRWADFVEVSDQVRLDINSLSIPVNELIAIATLYKEYEKEDMDLKADFKMLEPDFKPAIPTTQYAKADDWSKPYEPEIRTATAFHDYNKAGLLSEGKTVFESDKYRLAYALEGSARYFKFVKKNSEERECNILDARGRMIKIGGYDHFYDAVMSGDGSYYEFIGSIDKSKAPVYNTLWNRYSKYQSEWRPTNALTSEQLENRKRIDRMYFQEDKGIPNVDPAIKATWTKFIIYEVPVIITDKDLKVIKTETRYMGSYND